MHPLISRYVRIRRQLSIAQHTTTGEFGTENGEWRHLTHNAAPEECTVCSFSSVRTMRKTDLAGRFSGDNQDGVALTRAQRTSVYVPVFLVYSVLVTKIKRHLDRLARQVQRTSGQPTIILLVIRDRKWSAELCHTLSRKRSFHLTNYYSAPILQTARMDQVCSEARAYTKQVVEL